MEDDPHVLHLHHLCVTKIRPESGTGCQVTTQLLSNSTPAVTGITTMLPVKPNLMTDFFASRHMRHYIHCEDYSVQKAPQVRAEQLDIL